MRGMLEVWQSSQTHGFFSYLERTTRSCVDEPKCNSQFLAVVTNEIPFLLLPHRSEPISHKARTPHHTQALTISAVLHEHPWDLVTWICHAWALLLNTLPASSMLPHFAYVSTKLLPTKISESHPHSTICWWTHLPSSIATMLGHAFSTPAKVRESGCTQCCCICQNSSSVFCPCLHFTCPNTTAFQVTTSWDDTLLNTLQASSMLPHFSYMSIKLLHTKTLDSQTLSMSYLWTSLLSSSVPKPAHALITWTKVNLLGLIPSQSICWKSFISFSSCPSFTYFVSFWFHAKMFNCTVPGAITAIFAATHGRFSWSSSQRASCVFLCFKSGYLSFVYNQRFTSIWSAMYSPHPRHKWHHKNREKLHWPPPEYCICHLPTFSSLLLLSHQCKGPEKNSCQV